MKKQEVEIIRYIDTLKALLDHFKEQARPRAPLHTIRFALSLAIQALEKQIAKPPKDLRIDEESKMQRGICPNCGRYINIFNSPTVCNGCGQYVKWGIDEK